MPCRRRLSTLLQASPVEKGAAGTLCGLGIGVQAVVGVRGGRRTREPGKRRSGHCSSTGVLRGRVKPGQAEGGLTK
eukprot:scaffold19137_cov41-Phaeocystis_antarctica.AAC.6